MSVANSNQPLTIGIHERLCRLMCGKALPFRNGASWEAAGRFSLAPQLDLMSVTESHRLFGHQTAKPLIRKRSASRRLAAHPEWQSHNKLARRSDQYRER
jgi:hypothetical protein